MSTTRRSVTRLSLVALGALTLLPASRALAFKPTSAQEAQWTADRYRNDAEHYRSLGGVGYKTGLVQRAEASDAKYSAMAEEMTTPVAEPPAASPEAEHYAELAEHYRSLGGVAYKTGLVQWAEAQQLKHEAGMPAAASSAPELTEEQCHALKPAVRPPSCNEEGD